MNTMDTCKTGYNAAIESLERRVRRLMKGVPDDLAIRQADALNLAVELLKNDSDPEQDILEYLRGLAGGGR